MAFEYILLNIKQEPAVEIEFDARDLLGATTTAAVSAAATGAPSLWPTVADRSAMFKSADGQEVVLSNGYAYYSPLNIIRYV